MHRSVHSAAIHIHIHRSVHRVFTVTPSTYIEVFTVAPYTFIYIEVVHSDAIHIHIHRSVHSGAIHIHIHRSVHSEALHIHIYIGVFTVTPYTYKEDCSQKISRQYNNTTAKVL
ncbi:hypothetical protein DPMN_032166 [Dreissena polymorpha]|uniref:SEA domain-containing protein n=1 Tax=Dreissena polymorpha TaxID=45954 RepID=A0A9D4RK01_DREPO|nr:hypothetical protein DPMN_032166 [Dreissena polymorpha]